MEKNKKLKKEERFLPHWGGTSLAAYQRRLRRVRRHILDTIRHDRRLLCGEGMNNIIITGPLLADVVDFIVETGSPESPLCTRQDLPTDAEYAGLSGEQLDECVKELEVQLITAAVSMMYCHQPEPEIFNIAGIWQVPVRVIDNHRLDKKRRSKKPRAKNAPHKHHARA